MYASFMETNRTEEQSKWEKDIDRYVSFALFDTGWKLLEKKEPTNAEKKWKKHWCKSSGAVDKSGYPNSTENNRRSKLLKL